MQRPLALASFALFAACSSSDPPDAAIAPAPELEQADVFVGGVEGYGVYRIPSLIETPSGALLAFAEGRRNISDTGNIDLVMKRSTDGGATWSTLRVVVDEGDDTAGNPCPVVDRATGTVVLVYDTNPAAKPDSRRVLVTKSRDDGVSWSTPVDVSAEAKPANWSWYAVGPGRGIQLASGRLVVPADHHDVSTNVSASHVIYSDDGELWHVGGSLGPDTDEAQVAELDDGTLVVNARDLSAAHRRAIARSTDGGLTFSEVARDPTLRDPPCQGSLLATPFGLLFSNPDSEIAAERVRLTVRLSTDGARTWTTSKVLREGPSAYSALAPLPDGRIGCLYESGEKYAFAPYEKIVLARFGRDWLR